MMTNAKRGRGRERTEAADYFRFLLRMPEEMAVDIDRWAKDEYMPMNSYLLRVIRDHRRARLAEEAVEPQAGAVQAGGSTRARRVS